MGRQELEAEKKKSRLTATKGRLGWFRLVGVYEEGLPGQYKEAKLGLVMAHTSMGWHTEAGTRSQDTGTQVAYAAFSRGPQ